MKIQILISEGSWANAYKEKIRISLKNFSNKIKFIDNHKNLKKNFDINIIFSYFKKIPKKYLAYSKNNLIPHESRLPQGKGMSPLTWQILEGKNIIYFSLIEAESKFDSGAIYYQKKVNINKTLLFQEIKKIQLLENLKLINKFLKYLKLKKKIPNVLKKKGESSFYRRRNTKDSELNIDDTIKNQFNLLRVSDYKKYPAFFKIFGKKYKIKIMKL